GHHAIAGLEFHHSRADRDHVARAVRQRDRVAGQRPAEVGADGDRLIPVVERRGANTDEHLAWPRNGVWPLSQADFCGVPAPCGNDEGPHVFLVIRRPDPRYLVISQLPANSGRDLPMLSNPVRASAVEKIVSTWAISRRRPSSRETRAPASMRD